MIHRRGLFAFVALLLTATLLPAPAAAKGFASTRITVNAEGTGKDVIRPRASGGWSSAGTRRSATGPSS